jgi:flagellar FliL protein
MVKRYLAAALAATLLLGLLAGCNGDKPETFPGANDIPYPLGEAFTINLTAETEELKRFRYVVCDVVLELGDSASIKIFDERRHRLREIVIDAISTKTIDQLKTQSQRVDLRQEIMEKINEDFNTSTVRRVVFGSFYFH